MCLFLSPCYFSHSQLVKYLLGPGLRYRYFVYLSNNRVKNVLHVHKHVPITFGGQSLHIERTKNRPYGLPTDLEESLLKHEKPTSSALVEKLKEAARGGAGVERLVWALCMLWIGQLPNEIPSNILTSFWSRLGCIVEIHTCVYVQLTVFPLTNSQEIIK